MVEVSHHVTSLMDWVTGRLMEGTTYLGLFLVASGNWGLSSTSPSVSSFLHSYNEYAPQVGAFLVALTGRRHREDPGFRNIAERVGDAKI